MLVVWWGVEIFGSARPRAPRCKHVPRMCVSAGAKRQRAGCRRCRVIHRKPPRVSIETRGWSEVCHTDSTCSRARADMCTSCAHPTRTSTANGSAGGGLGAKLIFACVHALKQVRCGGLASEMKMVLGENPARWRRAPHVYDCWHGAAKRGMQPFTSYSPKTTPLLDRGCVGGWRCVTLTPRVRDGVPVCASAARISRALWRRTAASGDVWGPSY